jgi:CDP-diacylglycerol--glycerol-3-phosphate 3-phosphatidyltransferase
MTVNDFESIDVSSEAKIKPTSIWNVPNTLTAIRFVLAIAVMALIPLGYYAWANVIFVVAASTDWMDGYWARKYGQVTKFGRIFDPFVDKVIICGSFIALVGVAESPVLSWMATIVVARELLVTSLRGMIEGAGGDFSASWLGKWKMVFQCGAVVSTLLLLTYAEPPAWLNIVTYGLVWLSILITLYSGYDYTRAAARILSKSPENDSTESDSSANDSAVVATDRAD